MCFLKFIKFNVLGDVLKSLSAFFLSLIAFWISFDHRGTERRLGLVFDLGIDVSAALITLLLKFSSYVIISFSLLSL